MKEITIREISEADAESISELSSQQGYNIDSIQVRKQIESITCNRDHVAFVALRNNIIVGYIHGFHAIRLTVTPFFEIGGLVVKESEKRMGIGRMLVRHLEENANKYEMIRVRCNRKREFAHRFYTSLSYSEKKEQKIFQRKLHIN